MIYAKTMLPVMFLKQTLMPNPKHLRCLNQSSNVDQGVTRFRPITEDLKARITRYCKPNYTRIIRSTSLIKEAIVPVRFYPESSMHHASCTDFSKTRLHALPVTKSPENPGMCITPWKPFLGSFRWFTTNTSEADSAGKSPESKADKELKLNEMRRRLKDRPKRPTNTPRTGRTKRITV